MPIFAVGKSYGGRMASMAAAEGGIDPAGLVYLGYPLHPPGKPDKPRIEHLPERRFCVRRHIGPAEAVDNTRRAMYQHMISHELVGGPSALRHVEDEHRTEPLHSLDVLIGATCSFEGDDAALWVPAHGPVRLSDDRGARVVGGGPDRSAGHGDHARRLAA